MSRTAQRRGTRATHPAPPRSRYITSDCDADADVYNTHGYTDTPEEAVAAVLAAGTDVDCTSFVGNHAASALEQGLITLDDIDARLAMLFRVRMRLGHFDPPGPLQARRVRWFDMRRRTGRLRN